jgi:hypothetical protein
MIVAHTRSKYGGKCRSPNHEGGLIKAGDPIYKIGTTGETTRAGQGPGIWVCAVCAPAYENDDQ